jgi:hypothetical protein
MNNEEQNMEEICYEIIVRCPHCDIPILIEKLNCCIFRHGTFIRTGKQIDPHTCKKECDEYIEQKLIYGCGKPFKIMKSKNKENDSYSYISIVCDYI